MRERRIQIKVFYQRYITILNDTNLINAPQHTLNLRTAFIYQITFFFI